MFKHAFNPTDGINVNEKYIMWRYHIYSAMEKIMEVWFLKLKEMQNRFDAKDFGSSIFHFRYDSF